MAASHWRDPTRRRSRSANACGGLRGPVDDEAARRWMISAVPVRASDNSVVGRDEAVTAGGFRYRDVECVTAAHSVHLQFVSSVRHGAGDGDGLLPIALEPQSSCRGRAKTRVRAGSTMTMAPAIRSRPTSAIPSTRRSARRREPHSSGTRSTTMPGWLPGGNRRAFAKSVSAAATMRPSATARACTTASG